MNKMIVKVDPELAELIPAFFDNRRSDIELILSALKKSDYDPIKRVGHIMKGAGAGYGFDEITEIGKWIEEKAEIRDEDAVRNGVGRLAAYLERVEVVYE